MNKVIKSILIILLLILVSCVGVFVYNCIEKPYNDKLLSKLEGEILYTKRDDDDIIKIYKSKANLEDEQLIYEYKGSKDNNNIDTIKYDKERDIITFVAYDDEESNWMQFELDNKGNVKPLNKPQEFDVEIATNEYYNGIKTDIGIIENVRGSIYIREGMNTTLLKKYIGIYDFKLSSGYTPKKLSNDKKYLYYDSSKHTTPIGVILEGILFNDYKFPIYIMNLETKEESRYVDFIQLIELN